MEAVVESADAEVSTVFDRSFALIQRIVPQMRSYASGDYVQAEPPGEPLVHLDVIRLSRRIGREQPTRMVFLLSRNAEFNGTQMPDPEITFLIDFEHEIARPIDVRQNLTIKTAMKSDGTLDHASLIVMAAQAEDWLKALVTKGYVFERSRPHADDITTTDNAQEFKP